jgi:hypothetical protein
MSNGRLLMLCGLILTTPALSSASTLGSTAGGALSGAVIGGIIDGDDGAATGAAIGAGIGLMRGVSATAPQRAEQKRLAAQQQAYHDQLFADAQRVEIASLEPPPPPIPTPAVPALPAYSSPTVKRVQQALTDRGLYSGPIDGFDSPATVEAVKSYQTAQGLSVDGRSTMSLLDQLNSD